MRRQSISRRSVVALVMCGLLWAGSESVGFAHPDLVDPQSSEARAAVLKAFPGSIVRDWQPAPMPGLFMFTLNQDERIFFVDPTGQYLLAQAALFDMKKQKNLTQDFIIRKRRAVINALPLDHAIVYAPTETDSAGSKKPILVFDDPDCPFCRELHPEVKQLVAAGVPVAIFLHPVERIHKGATQKSMNIWCAENRNEALDLALAGKPVPETKQCETPIEQNLTLARQLGGGPTPYIVLPDGRTVQGKKSAGELLSMLGITPSVASQLAQ
jgi:thiol:disulfide interchange protein DsbC